MHVKTLRSQKLGRRRAIASWLQSKAIAIENDLRGTLRNFGSKAGMAGTVKSRHASRIGRNSPELAGAGRTAACRPAGVREQLVILHRRLLGYRARR